jgi:hypothetical protein
MNLSPGSHRALGSPFSDKECHPDPWGTNEKYTNVKSFCSGLLSKRIKQHVVSPQLVQRKVKRSSLPKACSTSQVSHVELKLKYFGSCIKFKLNAWHSFVKVENQFGYTSLDVISQIVIWFLEGRSCYLDALLFFETVRYVWITSPECGRRSRRYFPWQYLAFDANLTCSASSAVHSHCIPFPFWDRVGLSLSCGFGFMWHFLLGLNRGRSGFPLWHFKLVRISIFLDLILVSLCGSFSFIQIFSELGRDMINVQFCWGWLFRTSSVARGLVSTIRKVKLSQPPVRVITLSNSFSI